MPIVLLLSEDDQKQFGCAAVLEVSLVVKSRDAAEMQRPFFPNDAGELEGFTDPDEWREALRGKPMFDQYGAPVMADEEQPDGTTKQVQKRQPNFAANLALVWLALKGAKLDVPPLKEFEYDAAGARFYSAPDDEPEGQGKDESSDQETTSDG